MHPTHKSSGSANDLSCVLIVRAPGGRILLPGDIELAGELDLLSAQYPALLADIVVAPHHGSSTSSSIEFVLATRQGSSYSQPGTAIDMVFRIWTLSVVTRL